MKKISIILFSTLLIVSCKSGKESDEKNNYLDSSSHFSMKLDTSKLKVNGPIGSDKEIIADIEFQAAGINKFQIYLPKSDTTFFFHYEKTVEFLLAEQKNNSKAIIVVVDSEKNMESTLNLLRDPRIFNKINLASKGIPKVEEKEK